MGEGFLCAEGGTVFTPYCIVIIPDRCDGCSPRLVLCLHYLWFLWKGITPPLGSTTERHKTPIWKCGPSVWARCLLPLVNLLGNGSQKRSDRMKLISSVQSLNGNINRAAGSRLIVIYDQQLLLALDSILWPVESGCPHTIMAALLNLCCDCEPWIIKASKG